MKSGLIRLKMNKNIFYDSVIKQYRYRMHCPICGDEVQSGCRCYDDLDVLLSDIDDGIADATCSAKCCLDDYVDWDYIEEAMQTVGLGKDIKKCLSELTEKQSLEALKEYDIKDILYTLFCEDSKLTFSQIKNPTHQERLEMLWELGEAEDILQDCNIDIYPDCKDLSEEDAQKVLDYLIDECDFDRPSGEACPV